ncbi:MAG: double zinc ribbon domain-containing protein [Planctomycetaceae bacterium]|nr:double zinc ribbon domain-containing protein [Planctomycetaceae bacterium]
MFPFTGLLDLLCPPICPICGDVIENLAGNDEPFCSVCTPKIVTPDGQFCRRCGGRRFVAADNMDGCDRCRTAKFRFKRAIALGEYENDLRLLTLRMKTDKTGILAIAAAKALCIHRRTDLENVHADTIVPVPMHFLRRWDRGVNSPEILAEELGRQLKIPVARHRIQRTRPTDLQYTLSPKGRAENVAGAFALRRQAAFAGKNVLLVDDILTTGSTCNEISKILLAAGAESVTVVAAARAVGDYRQ